MHCLGASVSGQSSPSGSGAGGSVLNVIRALGVLVSEGRIQGGPRGYKEGPHCVAPLQSAPNDHLCEKDNCLVSFIIFNCSLLPSSFNIATSFATINNK